MTILDNNIFYFDNQAIPKSFNNDSNYNPYDLKSFLVKLEVDFEKMEILSQELNLTIMYGQKLGAELTSQMQLYLII